MAKCRRCGSADAAQEAAIEALQRIYLQLTARSLSPWRRLRLALLRDTEIARVQGLYLWGGVGRGKTRLMDMFYRALPFRQKRRRHFHRFMYELHERLAFEFRRTVSRLAEMQTHAYLGQAHLA